MIVITHEKDLDYSLLPGDTVHVTYCDSSGKSILLDKVIVDSHWEVKKLICFVFCDSQGYSVGTNLNYFFGDILPEELLNATKISDLPYEVASSIKFKYNI